MDSAVLIAILCTVYVPAQIHLYKADLFFSAAYFYLFIYGIFAVVGYVYFPELSQLISAYFGKDIEQSILVFMILSFISIYWALLVAARHSRRSGPGMLIVERLRFNYPAVSTVLVLAVLVAQIAGLLEFGDVLSYTNANDPDFNARAGLGYKLWYFLFKSSLPMLTVLYAAMRYQIWTNVIARWWLVALFLAELAVFLKISHELGNRLDLVGLFNAMIFVELIRRNGIARRKSTAFYAGMIIVTLISVSYMTRLSSTRTENPYGELGFFEATIFQDYFPPAHILFAAAAYKLTDLSEVLTSNFMNMLILMDYPYLQQYVMDVFNPGVATRHTGYAFYALSEGYLAFGGMGFIYNGLVIGFGLWMWRRIASTNSETMNAMLLPIFAMDIVNICRGQSAYFVKLLYLHSLPAVIVLFIVTGYYFRGIRLRRHELV